MAVAASRDEEKYTLSVELETKTIHPALHTKVGQPASYIRLAAAEN